MLYLDDRLPVHPKILRAGQRLGVGGASCALHLYVLGISYARTYLTDGFLPFSFIASCGVIPKRESVANALSSRGVGLWRKVKGGYRIHDFHHYNPKASEERDKRERHRLKMAAWRAAKGQGRSPFRDVVVTESHASSSTSTTVQSTSTGVTRRLALARKPEKPSFALACVVMQEARQLSWQIDHDGTLANVGEHFKQLCAERGLAYDADLVRRAFEAVCIAAITRKRA
jgi:hypothetical protein